MRLAVDWIRWSWRGLAVALVVGLAACGAKRNAPPGGADAGTDGKDPCAAGAAVFDQSVIHRVDIELSAGDWQAMKAEAAASPEYGGPNKVYYPASLTWDGDALPGMVGFRLKGHGSLLETVEEGRDAYPFKVDLNRLVSGQKLDGLKKINLHPRRGPGDNLLKEYLAYGAVAELGMPASRTAFVDVSVNGVSLGIYNVVEQVDGRFIKCHYDAPRGQLYKPEEGEGSLGPEFVYDSFDRYATIEHKWPDPPDHGPFLEMMRVIQRGLPDLASVVDVDGVLRYVAAEAVLGNWDQYASTGHNYYLYERNPGVFTMIIWDLDHALEATAWCGPGSRDPSFPLVHYLLTDPPTVARYKTIATEFLQGAASATRLTARLDAILPLVASRLGDSEEVSELRATVAKRHASLEQQLASAPAVCEGEDEGKR